MVMAEIDVKFSKGNKQTLKAMSTTYKAKPPKQPAKSAGNKKK